jgi:hypothetical protein
MFSDMQGESPGDAGRAIISTNIKSDKTPAKFLVDRRPLPGRTDRSGDDSGLEPNSLFKYCAPLTCTEDLSDEVLSTSIFAKQEAGDATVSGGINLIPSRQEKRRKDQLLSFATTTLDHLDWLDSWNLAEEDLGSKSKDEIKYQRMLDELYSSEKEFLNGILVSQYVYKQALLVRPPKGMDVHDLRKLATGVWDWTDSLYQLHLMHILEPMIQRRGTEGPWVSTYVDILNTWLERAKPLYREFAKGYHRRELTIREMERGSSEFKKFLDEGRAHSKGQKLGWDSWLKLPVRRIARYGLLHKAQLETAEHGRRDVTMIKMIKQFIEKLDGFVHEVDLLLGEGERAMSMRQLRFNFYGINTEIIPQDPFVELEFQAPVMVMAPPRFRRLQDAMFLIWRKRDGPTTFMMINTSSKTDWNSLKENELVVS